MPDTTLTWTGREFHRTVITLDSDLEPESAVCECGAHWSELNHPPATEWFRTHTTPGVDWDHYHRILELRQLRKATVLAELEADWVRRTTAWPA